MRRGRKKNLNARDLRELGVDPDRVYRKIQPPAGKERVVKPRKKERT